MLCLIEKWYARVSATLYVICLIQEIQSAYCLCTPLLQYCMSVRNTTLYTMLNQNFQDKITTLLKAATIEVRALAATELSSVCAVACEHFT